LGVIFLLLGAMVFFTVLTTGFLSAFFPFTFALGLFGAMFFVTLDLAGVFFLFFVIFFFSAFRGFFFFTLYFFVAMFSPQKVIFKISTNRKC